MSRIYLQIATFIILSVLVASIAARAFGEQQPANATIRGFKDDCQNASDICWHGITINQTTMTEAENKLQSYVYTLAPVSAQARALNSSHNAPCGAYLLYESVKVSGVVMRCRGLLLGDWINHFGMPDAVGQSHDVLFYTGKTKMRLQIIGELTPDAPIAEFALYLPHVAREFEYDWRGFAPQWRYCQLNIPNPCM